MKKAFCVAIALLMTGTVLLGCGSKDGTAEVPQPSQATITSQPSEVTITLPPTATPAADRPEPLVSKDAAYEGVSRYCERELGMGMTAEGYSVNLETGEETDSEYQLIFHSYTGALTYFYVDKASGATRMTEYVPSLDSASEAGTFSLFDYLGPENKADPAAEGDVPSEPKERFVFQSKVCSVYMEEVFGKTMCEAWYSLVDAVMAGENTFACPDQHTYDWVMGQFPERCFPVLVELIDYAYDREHSVKDGVANFTWRVPPEEAAARIEQFAAQIEEMLNDVLEADYTDFEKALALYDYFSRNYDYDYEMAEQMENQFMDEVKTIRLFNEGTGICQEVSAAYSYLLMQAGVEATVMMGDGHQWSYVRINGHNYHIDPTFVLSEKDSLAYFMMNDEQRAATGYEKSCFTITSNYAQDHPHPDYVADDDTFRPLWEHVFEQFSHEEHTVYCPTEENDYGEWSYFTFDYAG